jgi:geranylgeranyl pyrophosphate synthase
MGSSWDFGVSKELTEVERRIRASVKSGEPLLTEIASYVIDSGGKRLRPTVALLAFKASGGGDPAQIIELAAAFELIHSATLIHDDINDGGGMRRGKVSAYVKYGVQNALVTGDFLYVKGFAIGGKSPPEIVDLTADVCAMLAEGEIAQKKHSGDVSLTDAQYLDIIRRKTALPIGASAQTGAMLAGASPRIVSDMADYGVNLGIAFQIVDDVLDVTGDPSVLGKPVGSDIREGNVTLPTIHALNNGSSVNREELMRIIRRKNKNEDHVRKAMDIIRRSGAVEKALADAESFSKKAKDSLHRIPSDNRYKAEMEKLADFVIERSR